MSEEKKGLLFERKKKFLIKNDIKNVDELIEKEINKILRKKEFSDDWKKFLSKERNEVNKTKRKTDILYKLKTNLSGRISSALNSYNTRYHKKHPYGKVYHASREGSTLDLIGGNIQNVKKHLTSQFDDNMCWGNYGTYWQIDHIIPCAKYSIWKKEEQFRCFNYRNLRPLEASLNESKSNKIDMELIKEFNITDLLPYKLQ